MPIFSHLFTDNKNTLMRTARIYLTGFMTSGKSTIGPILANVLGWNFFDLDSEIQKAEGSTVVEIFEEKGEKYFRERETILLEKLSHCDDVIISLGGGTISFDNNFEIIKNSGKIIYLKSSPEAIYRRIKSKTDRPLFKDLVVNENSREQFIERINEVLLSREPYYLKADLVINTDDSRIGKTVDIIAKKIKNWIYEKNKN